MATQPLHPTRTAELDAPLHAVGFEIDVVSADLVCGRLTVTERCCQVMLLSSSSVPLCLDHEDGLRYVCMNGGGGGVGQPYKVLHGGVSALIAEALASIGALVACEFKRVAGVQLSINHHRSARLGDRVLAEATPVHVGKTIQVWEVKTWKTDEPKSGSEKGLLLSSSRVTILVNMAVPDDSKDVAKTFKRHVAGKKYARLSVEINV
ncbi:1,4-dihydroxy-2-naphthoyl-CoA thioesterase 1-like isoform X2 [Canna indica]|uniref:1,4-dihydroxy-2-naphthoyl-CoA thioesterase 1-like isoform X2 n=1 Tax=Canna indica TaxID=4628 RepID=A0AAQ3JKY1_9LILI|nr:1,4-dihydroxy-2-naphthoyl-CoA thioesterase 1-like isoform X2 [Canna indica]